MPRRFAEANEPVSDRRQVKLCSKCNTVKPLEGNYYRKGNNWQNQCKTCNTRLTEKQTERLAYFFEHEAQEVMETVDERYNITQIRWLIYNYNNFLSKEKK